MYRTLAVIALVLGMLTVGVASVSNFHLRQLALSAGPIDLLDHLDYRMMTIGMRDNARSNVIVAADFARQLQTRIYIVLGVGLTLLLSGGALLLQSRHIQHEQSVGRGAAGSAVPNV